MVKPRGYINSLTEIRENYQDPNPYPPRRPFIYKLADTLEKVQHTAAQPGYLHPNKFECCIQLVEN